MKKKGFTLVEIIICLVLIVLIGTISIIYLRKNKIDKTEKAKKELENAISVISDKLSTTNSLKKYNSNDHIIDDNSVSTYYCYSKSTLIKDGIVPENNEIIKHMKNNEYIYVKQNGLGNYEIDYPVTADRCKYYIASIESISGNDDNEFTGGDKDDRYNLKEKFDKIDNNNYQMKLTFTKDVYSEEVSPLYVIFVLDTSGSMNWNDSSGLAKTSIKNFGTDILNNISNSKIGFLPFATSAYPQKFLNSYWTTNASNFSNVVNRVSYGGDNSYSLAYNSIVKDYLTNRSEPLEKNAMKYVVMFSDAGDGPTCYTNNNKNLVVNSIAPLVDRIIFIAYNPGSVNCLLTISNEVNKKYPGVSTHLFSNNRDVDKILENVSNIVKEETKYNNVKISIKVNEEYFSVINNEEWDINYNTNTLSKIIDFSNLKIDVLETELSFDIVYNEKSNINNYEDEISIIESIILEFEKKDGSIETVTIDSTKLPVTKITTKEKSVIN